MSDPSSFLLDSFFKQAQASTKQSKASQVITMPLTEISNRVGGLSPGPKDRSSSVVKKSSENVCEMPIVVRPSISKNVLLLPSATSAPSQPLKVTTNVKPLTSSFNPRKNQTLPTKANKVVTAPPPKPTAKGVDGSDWSGFLCQPLKGAWVYKDVPFIQLPKEGTKGNNAKCHLCQSSMHVHSLFLHCKGKRHRQAYMLLDKLHTINAGDNKGLQDRVDKCLSLQARITALPRVGLRNAMNFLLVQHLGTSVKNRVKNWEKTIIKNLEEFERLCKVQQSSAKSAQSPVATDRATIKVDTATSAAVNTNQDEGTCAKQEAAEAMIDLKTDGSVVSDDLQYSPFSQEDGVFFTTLDSLSKVQDLKIAEDKYDEQILQNLAIFELLEMQDDEDFSDDDLSSNMEDWEDDWNLELHIDESLITIPEVNETMQSFLELTLDQEQEDAVVWSVDVGEQTRAINAMNEPKAEAAPPGENVRTALAVIEALAFFKL